MSTSFALLTYQMTPDILEAESKTTLGRKERISKAWGMVESRWHTCDSHMNGTTYQGFVVEGEEAQEAIFDCKINTVALATRGVGVT